MFEPAKGKYLSNIGKLFECPRRWFEPDWLYRRRLLKNWKSFFTPP